MKMKQMKIGTKTIMWLASGVFAVSVQAVPINGYIAFQGSGLFNSSSLATATAITSFNNVTVASLTQTGDYSGLDGAAVMMNGFAFASPPVNPWWTFTVGGVTYSFNIGTINIDTQNSLHLDLSGTGTATMTGRDATVGVWSLSTQNSGKNSLNLRLSFSADTTVPDGGATVAFLGFALVGIEGLRRKFAK
jgi:hypothetical protein